MSEVIDFQKKKKAVHLQGYNFIPILNQGNYKVGMCQKYWTSIGQEGSFISSYITDMLRWILNKHLKLSTHEMK